jgi:hypothetical protein
VNRRAPRGWSSGAAVVYRADVTDAPRGPSRDLLLAAAFAGIGLVATFALVQRLDTAPRARFADEPASGDVGVVLVYAQRPEGPLRLRVDQRPRLPRPQDLVFGVDVSGVGPRLVHVEVRAGGEVIHTIDELVRGPLQLHYFDGVLRLGDATPDAIEIEGRVEAPHTRPRTVRYALELGAPLAPEVWDAHATPAPQPPAALSPRGGR